MTTTHHQMPESVWTWHATSAPTGGAFALAEVTFRPGAEPPLHLHVREDEAFFVLDGEVTFMVGLDRVDAGAGDYVFAPRGVPHGFAAGTPEVRMLILLTPGGLEEAFLAHSRPTPVAELPAPLDGPPSPEAMAPFVAALTERGVTLVGPPVGAMLGAQA